VTRENLPTTIAIDGPAASGKSTLGRVFAERLGYAFLDTGLMYRAFTLAALRAGIPAVAEPCAALAATLDMRVEAGVETRVFLNDEDVTPRLRDPEVEANVSRFSALPTVRDAMVKQQREIAARQRSVLAGRDIGTVVLPDAPLKFYLDASEQARAERRGKQAGAWGTKQATVEAQRDIAGRDTVDTSRATSPLRPAEDAIIIDTTALTLDEVIAFALEKVECAAR
jgi:cytidylate kinase